MLSATSHRRAAINSLLVGRALASSSTPPALDPLLEQFLPPRSRPPPQLHLNSRLVLLRHFAAALKTDPKCSTAVSSLLLGFHPAPLADLLRSLRTAPAGLAFLALLFPDLSPDFVLCSCDAVFLLFSDNDLKPLAQNLLAGLLRRLGANRAADLFRWSRLHRSRASCYHALHLVLRAFIAAGMVSDALEALSEIRRDENIPSLSVCSILLRLLFRTGDSRKAWSLFRDMFHGGPLPSVLTFNAMILGSCLKGQVAAGEGLLWLMPKFNLSPDACSFNIVMKAYCILGWTTYAFKLFDEMLETGHTPTIVTYNILINILCRQGKMKEARRWFDLVFNTGYEANTITYNVLLDGYMKAGQIDVANSTYVEMVKKGFRPDLYTFNILVSGYNKFHRDREELVQNLFRDAAIDEVRKQMLISSFCWDGQMEDARSMMLGYANHGFLPKVSVFNSIITGYSTAGLEEEAFNMYRIMVDEFGLAPSSSTWQYLILGLCRGGRLTEAKDLLYEIVERGLNVGLSAFIILMDTCFRFGKLSDAMNCLNYMEKKGFSFDVVGFSAYINGLCQLELVQEANGAFTEMCKRGLIPHIFVYNSLLSVLFRIGDIEEATKLEADMRCIGLLPNIFTSNIVINGYCRQGYLARANDKLQEMGWNGIYPDVVTFNTLIAAAYRALDAQRLEKYFEIMSFRDCKPDIFTYNIRIHSLCSSYKTIEAIKLVDILISEGLAPNAVTHNTVMNGICADRLGLALILTGKLIKMAIVPNIVTLNLLLSHFCKQGLAERALMWGEKFKSISFDFNGTTLRILEKANNIVQSKLEINVESGKDLFLEFLMFIVYELICNHSQSAKHKPLPIKSLVDSCLTGVPKMLDVR